MPKTRFLAVVFGLLATATPALSQPTYTWQPTTDGNWSVAANWRDQANTPNTPVSGNTTVLNFGGTTVYTATNNLGAFTLNAMNFSGSGAKTIAGTGVLTLAGTNAAINVAAGSGAVTISSGLVIGANNTITNSSTNLLTLGAVTYSANTTTTFTGAGNITAGGTQTFANNSVLTYTGTGTLNLGATAGSAFAFGNGNTITINNGTSGGSNTGSLVLRDGGTYSGTNVVLNLANHSTGTFSIGNLGPMSGIVNVNAGTVRFAGDAAGDLFGTNLTLNVAAGSTFNFHNHTETLGAISGTGTLTSPFNGVIATMGQTGNRTWGGNIAGNLGFSTGIAGANYTFTGTNTGTGNVIVVAGSSLTLGNGGTTGSVAGGITNNGTLTFNRSDNISLSFLTGSGSLVKDGTGTLTITNTTGYTGSTVVAAGTLKFNTAFGLPTASAQVTVASGAVLDLSAIGGTYIFNGSARTLTAGRTGTPANDVLGDVAIDQQSTLNVGGTGTIATATFANNLTLNAARLRFDFGPTPAIGNDRVAVAGNLSLANSNTIFVNFTNGSVGEGTYTLFTYGGTLTGTSSNILLNGLGGGRQSFTFSTGTGTNSAITMGVTGSTANLTWTGGTNNTWDRSITAGNFSGATDTRYYDNDTVTFGDTGAGTVNVVGVLSPTLVTVNSSANYTFANPGTGTSILAANGPVVKNGSGTLTVATNLSSTIGVTVNAGTLAVVTGGSIGNGSPLNVTGGTVTTSVANALPGTVNITGGTVSVPSLTSFFGNAAISLNGGTLAVTGNSERSATQVITVESNGGTINVADGFTMSTFGNQLVGPTGTLTKTGNGTLTIGFNSTSTVGTYRVDGGVFEITSQRIGGVNAIVVNSGSTFQVRDTLSINSLIMAGGATITLNGNGFNGTGAYRHVHDVNEQGIANTTIPQAVSLPTTARFTLVNGSGNTDTVTNTFSGVLSGNGGIIKDGTGTMILSAANTYTGTTGVVAGTLLINGDNSAATGAVTVTTGGTLGGTGTVGGATTVQNGGTIRGDSGSGTGTLTTGNVTVNSGGAIFANLGASGTNSQLVVGANTLNLRTGSKLNLTALGVFTNAAAGTYTIATLSDGNNLQLDGTGSQPDGFSFGTYVQGTGASGAVVIDTTALNFTLATGDTFSLNRVGNNLVLSFTPVPEPATVLAIGAAGLGLAGWARRRRNAKAAN